MALALYQKARDHLPFLLDPAMSPSSKVSLADGLTAALIFFVLQGICSIFLVGKNETLTGAYILIGFSVAGAIVFISLKTIYWKKKTEGVPKIFGIDSLKAISYGLGGGLIAGILGVLYIKTITHFGFFAKDLSKAATAEQLSNWWFYVLLILAAPLFEEFIFRGIIFRGLLRTWKFSTAAFASAAIFAIVHPQVSVIPVFMMAVIAAFGYVKTNLLITPIVAHAVYNFIVVFLIHWI